ncbi:MAG: hypothetical protein KKE65_06835 [Actinobacteria bacterium]|jgi:hypothetical protein|nr:hypothetical protein [Actinomycetota bacterium]MBU2111357.1 hypothetical protein [Actinomycetota bacterium]
MFNHEAYEAMEKAATWVDYFKSYPRCGHTVIVQGAAVEVGSGKVAWRVSTAESGEYLATDFADDREAAEQAAQQFIDEHIDPDSCEVDYCTPELSREIQRETTEMIDLLIRLTDPQ